MSKKTYKTVSGLLRSGEERLGVRLYKLNGDELIAATKTGQRDILNNLLPQIEGLPVIAADVDPLDGINQLLAIGGSERQVKALKDCLRWLKSYRILTGMTFSGVKVISEPRESGRSIIYRGYSIKEINGTCAYSVSKNGAIVSPQPTEEAALRWVDAARLLDCPLSSALPQPSRPRLVCYRVDGFKRDDRNVRVIMIVDADPEDNFSGDGRPHAIAEKIAPNCRFPFSENIDHPVPDAAKNRLLSAEELYALVPKMNPKRTRPRKHPLPSASQAEPPVRRKKTPLNPAHWRR